MVLCPSLFGSVNLPEIGETACSRRRAMPDKIWEGSEEYDAEKTNKEEEELGS
jgi:hypothetical protein